MTRLGTLDRVVNGSRSETSTDGQYLHRKELEQARQIHESLLPTSFSHPLADVAVHFRPRDWLGGDYCQVIQDDRSLYLTICDVTGHNVGSAMLAARVSMVVRGLAEACLSPQAIVERLDDFFHRYYASHAESLFLSFLACRIDLDDLSLTYSAAGHPGPIVVSAGAKEGKQLRTQNLLIGVERSCLIEPAENTIHLEPGDRIALFTDGVTDASRDNSGPIGRIGLESLLLQHAKLSVFQLSDGIMETLDDESCEALQDDRTLILVELK
ncbi:hypothetical protein BH23PLA1_BH23PLA1_03120 [soil metagenome]